MLERVRATPSVLHVAPFFLYSSSSRLFTFSSSLVFVVVEPTLNSTSRPPLTFIFDVYLCVFATLFAGSGCTPVRNLQSRDVYARIFIFFKYVAATDSLVHPT